MQPQFCAFFTIFTCKTTAFSKFLITVMSPFFKHRDILAFRFTKILGYKTHPDFGTDRGWSSKISLKNAAPYNQKNTVLFKLLFMKHNNCKVQSNLCCSSLLSPTVHLAARLLSPKSRRRMAVRIAGNFKAVA